MWTQVDWGNAGKGNGNLQKFCVSNVDLEILFKFSTASYNTNHHLCWDGGITEFGTYIGHRWRY